VRRYWERVEAHQEIVEPNGNLIEHSENTLRTKEKLKIPLELPSPLNPKKTIGAP